MARKDACSVVEDFLKAIGNRQCVSRIEKTVLAVYELEMQIVNGGFHQFFFNPSGDRWRDALESLSEIKAAKILKLFAKALSLFPESSPSPNTAERNRQLFAIGRDGEQLLYDLDEEYYELYAKFPEEDSYRRLVDYIETHRCEIKPSWITPNVAALARTIECDETFDRLPILADALEDAGCTDRDILDHCRGPGPHVRGCWVVDLLLGKE